MRPKPAPPTDAAPAPKPSGGSAFPTCSELSAGMSRRDYYAAHALAGLLAQPTDQGDWPPAVAAMKAAEYADALIAELTR
jgi:hypothetical protein